MKPSFLITSGPTREYLDPVRYFSNASSGKMGAELADAALKTGSRVMIISGNVSVKYHGKADVVWVNSAREMLREVKKYLNSADIIIGAAAVSDYRPKRLFKKKIKKSNNFFQIEMVKNPDIMEYAGINKKDKVAVGFALETNDLIGSARKKLWNKKLDLIVANSEESIGKDSSDFTLIFKNGKTTALKSVSKNNIAKRIVNEAVRIWKSNQSS